MAETELSTYFWRDHAKKRYQEIRQAQAQKLLPLQTLLAAQNYEKIEGSLITAEQIHNPAADSAIYLEKRLNYVMLMDQLQCKNMMEIGFNWGYSASLLLESAPAATLHSVDIGWHWYTPPAGNIIAEIYPGRFRYTWQDSREALLNEVRAGNRYDMISVDGGHDYSIASSDIVLGTELLKEGGLLMVDDTDGPSVGAAVLSTVANHPEYVELTAANFGVFEFGTSTIPCFEQRYFLKRRKLTQGCILKPEIHGALSPSLPGTTLPGSAPGLLQRAKNKLKHMISQL